MLQKSGAYWADRILGLSVETEATALNLDPAIIDYAGAGPVFATQTKRDHKMPIGFTGLKRLCSCLTVPVVAIGGLKEEHCTPRWQQAQTVLRWSLPFVDSLIQNNGP